MNHTLYILRRGSSMKGRDIKIHLGAVQTTLLLPLYARAKEAEKKDPIVCDTFAKDVVSRIDYDFSKIESAMKGGHQLMWAIRAYNFDNEIRAFLTKRPYIDKNI